MKKRITAIILTSMLAVTAALPTFAADYWTEDVNFSATGGVAVIDGKVDGKEWDNAEAIVMKLTNDPIAEQGNVSYQGEWEAEENRADTDYLGTYKFMYDDKNLYILEDRIDNKVVLTGSVDLAHDTDGVLVFLQVSEEGSDINPDGFSHHIFYTAGKDGKIGGDVKVRICNNSDGSKEVATIDGAKVVSTLTDKGYMVEMAIPWTMVQKQIPNFKGPKVGDKMGLSFVVGDSDIDDGAFQKQFCYGLDMAIAPSNGYDFGGWSTLTLKAAPAAPETTAAPAPETTAAPVAESVAEADAALTPTVGDTTTAPQTSDVSVALFAMLTALSVGSIALVKNKKSK